jgi:hypothetical protein
MIDLNDIKAGIAEFETFKKNIEKQQLTYPLDPTSRKILFKDVLVPDVDFTLIPYGLGVYNKATEFVLNGVKYWLETTDYNNY